MLIDFLSMLLHILSFAYTNSIVDREKRPMSHVRNIFRRGAKMKLFQIANMIDPNFELKATKKIIKLANKLVSTANSDETKRVGELYIELGRALLKKAETMNNVCNCGGEHHE